MDNCIILNGHRYEPYTPDRYLCKDCALGNLTVCHTVCELFGNGLQFREVKNDAQNAAQAQKDVSADKTPAGDKKTQQNEQGTARKLHPGRPKKKS